MVLASRLSPPQSKPAYAVFDELGVQTMHHNMLFNALRRAHDHQYHHRIAQACFEDSVATIGLNLLLYDVTTLYLETKHEDTYRKIGYSKEHRVDSQIVIGLLVDRSGFPLKRHNSEGNTAETHTIVPILQAFQARHQAADLVVVADASMLSTDNLAAIDAGGLRFVVDSKLTKAPHDLAKYFQHQSNDPADGTTVDTLTTRGKYRPDPHRLSSPDEPVWDPDQDARHWQAVWQYRTKRARRDLATLGKQRDKTLRIVENNKQ